MRVSKQQKSIIVQNFTGCTKVELERLAFACAAVLKVMNSTPFTPTVMYFPDDEDYGECYKIDLIAHVCEEYRLQ